MRAVALLALSMLALAVPAWGAERTPTLRLVATAPLVVQGTGFKSREPVLLTARIGTVRRFAGSIARGDGTFTARFRIRITTDTDVVVRAVGGRGSRATLKARHG